MKAQFIRDNDRATILDGDSLTPVGEIRREGSEFRYLSHLALGPMKTGIASTEAEALAHIGYRFASKKRKGKKSDNDLARVQ